MFRRIDPWKALNISRGPNDEDALSPEPLALKRCVFAVLSSLFLVNASSLALGLRLERAGAFEFCLETSAMILICWGGFFAIYPFARDRAWIPYYLAASGAIYTIVLCGWGVLRPYSHKILQSLPSWLDIITMMIWVGVFMIYGAFFIIGFIVGLLFLDPRIIWKRRLRKKKESVRP